ncbi:MAG: hypothetical protein CVU43_04565 [Chloroflexi bacterium HGW-Chloroflexi-5]|jgi:hypothetical protein|nr:MAG: hypothetical protein CVU43_04565 [Chloroflexi bacterium HGW-Chloroflexi-5]
MVEVVAYQPVLGVPISDYFDFYIGRQFPDYEVTVMAQNGVMPPGVVLQMKGGWPCVVVGDYDKPQKVERLVIK